jgi:hypothetical protein
MAAPQVPTPGVTPAQDNPYGAPYGVPEDGTRGMEGQEGERGLGVGCEDGEYTAYKRLTHTL